MEETLILLNCLHHFSIRSPEFIQVFKVHAVSQVCEKNTSFFNKWAKVVHVINLRPSLFKLVLRFYSVLEFKSNLLQKLAKLNFFCKKKKIICVTKIATFVHVTKLNGTIFK